MSTVGMVLTGVLMVIAVCRVVIIIMQNKRAAGLGAMGGSNNGGDSYWSKNKGNSIEGALSRYTKIGGALFMIIAALIMFIR